MAGGRRIGCCEVLAAQHILGRLEVLPAPRRLSKPVCLSVLLYHVSVYKSTLLWEGGGVSRR